MLQGDGGRGVFSLFMPEALWKKLGITPRLTPGRWMEYRIERPGATPEVLRVSVIPTGKGVPKDRRVLEARRTLATGDREYLKIQVVGDLRRPKNIERLMMARTGLPPMELPLELLGQHGFEGEVDVKKMEGSLRIRKVGRETLQTPAGTFDTTHFQIRAAKGKVLTDVWVAPAAGLWGLVKAVTEDRTQTLIAVGEGATTDLPPFAPRAASNRDGAASGKREGAAQGKGRASEK